MTDVLRGFQGATRSGLLGQSMRLRRFGKERAVGRGKA
jgi:hypothetical protein